MPSNFLESIHMVHCMPSGICAAGGDWGDGAVTSDIISMANAETCVFFILITHNAGGNSVVTVEACSTASAAATAAISFNVLQVRAIATTGGDTHIAIVKDVAAYTTTTGLDTLYAIEVDKGALMASGYEYVRLVCPETTNAAYGGGVFAILTNLRYEPLTATQLT